MGKATVPRSKYELLKLCMKWLPYFLYGTLRAATCRASFGKRPFMLGKIRFGIRGKAIFGNNSFILATPVGVNISVENGAILTVGDKFFMNFGTSLVVRGETRIGNNVMLAPYASITDDNQHETEPGSITFKGPVIIGNNVWIGTSAVVNPGVSIGDGSVIGANSVVSRDIPPSSFAAGAPARVIRKLEIPEGWVRV
jgi:acetyltransferase-like isoleucine patch superfamily enzyme